MSNPLENFKKEVSGLAELLPKPYAISQGLCAMCKKPPLFYSEMGRREYRISALCEFCFDETTTMLEDTCKTCSKPFEFHKHKAQRGECNEFVNRDELHREEDE